MKSLTALAVLLFATASVAQDVARDTERVIFRGVSATAAASSVTLDEGAGTRSVALFVSYAGIAGSPQGCHIAIRGGIDPETTRLLRPANLSLREPDGREFFLLNLRARYLVFQYSCLNAFPKAGAITAKAIVSTSAVLEPKVISIFRTTTPPIGRSAGYGGFIFDPFYPFVGLSLLSDGVGRITIDQVSNTDTVSQAKTVIDVPVQEPTTPAPGMGLHPVNLWCIPIYPDLTAGREADVLPFGTFSSQWQKNIGASDPSRFELKIVGLSPDACSDSRPRQIRIAFSTKPLRGNASYSGPAMRRGSGLFDEIFYLITTDQPGTVKIVQWTGDLTAERTTDSIAVPAGTSSGVLSVRGDGLRCEILNGATAQTQLDFSCWIRKR